MRLLFDKPPKRPIGNLLVSIERSGVTQCVADVTGIDDPQTLYWGMAATLWDHNVSTNGGFSHRNHNLLNADTLFDLCHQHCDSGGSLKISEGEQFGKGYVDIVHEDDCEGLTQLRSVVAELFSHHGHPICNVSLSGIAQTWAFCDRIVSALQWQHFYLPGRRIRTKIFSSDGRNLAELKNRAFLEYFEKHRGGTLQLTVEAYRARTAPRIIKTPPQSPGALDGLQLPLGRTVFTLMSFRSKVCTVNLVDAKDGQAIRSRVFDALEHFDYLVRPETPIQISASYDPEAEYVSYLTDQALFDLCREQSDTDGSLHLFVEIPIAIHATECPRALEGESPNISVAIFDWKDSRKCCDMQLQARGVFLTIREALGIDFVVWDIHMENRYHSLTIKALENWAKWGGQVICISSVNRSPATTHAGLSDDLAFLVRLHEMKSGGEAPSSRQVSILRSALSYDKRFQDSVRKRIQAIRKQPEIINEVTM